MSKTIASVLLTCVIGDTLTHKETGFQWRVDTDYIDEPTGDRIMVAMPFESNSDPFELWTVGLESYACLEGLSKD